MKTCQHYRQRMTYDQDGVGRPALYPLRVEPIRVFLSEDRVVEVTVFACSW